MAGRSRRGEGGEAVPLRAGEDGNEALEMVEFGQDAEGDKDMDHDEEAAGSWAMKRRRRGSKRNSKFMQFIMSPIEGSDSVKAAWVSVPISIAFLIIICLVRPLLPHPGPLKHVHSLGPNFGLVAHMDPKPLSLVELRVTTPGLKPQEEAHHKRIEHPDMDFDEEGPYGVMIELQKKPPEGEWENLHGPEELTVDESAGQTVLQMYPGDVNEENEVRLHVTSKWNETFYLPISIRAHQYGTLGLAKEWISAVVLIGMLLLIGFKVVDKVLAAMTGSTVMLGLLVLLDEAPTLKEAVSWIDLGTLGLLFGMMLLVGQLSETGFFEVVTLKLVRASKGSKKALMLILGFVTAIFSAFLDNVTTVLLVAPVTLSVAKSVEMNAAPLLMTEVLFSNIGGTATQIGDPPNLIIGNVLSDHLGFMDFIYHLTPAVILVMAVASVYCIFVFRSHVKDPYDPANLTGLTRNAHIKDPVLLAKTGSVMAAVILAFLLHSVHEVKPAWIAVLGAIMLLVMASPKDVHHPLEHVEIPTLMFFAGLFVMVEAIKEAGLIRTIGEVMANFIRDVDEGSRQMTAMTLIMWVSALISAFVDNIPWTTVMVKVVEQLGSAGLGLSIRALAWALALGACFGGNGALIGASANVVVSNIAENNGYHLSFGYFLKIGFPLMVISIGISNLYCIGRYPG